MRGSQQSREILWGFKESRKNETDPYVINFLLLQVRQPASSISVFDAAERNRRCDSIRL